MEREEQKTLHTFLQEWHTAPSPKEQFWSQVIQIADGVLAALSEYHERKEVYERLDAFHILVTPSMSISLRPHDSAYYRDLRDTCRKVLSPPIQPWMTPEHPGSFATKCASDI